MNASEEQVELQEPQEPQELEELEARGELGAPTPTDVPVLRRAAMDCLARREHSFFELSTKLLRKFPDCESNRIESVLDQLRQESLQSDFRFAESYVRFRKQRGFGYRHIRAHLRDRRVGSDIIDKVLFPDDDDWQVIANRLLRQRLGDARSLKIGSREHARLSRFLESRGFFTAQIVAAVAQFLEVPTA